ncbi:MAG: MmcQ/YjbR family DNA-binding protein [Acidobacteriota bacterium]|nr:MmcQ/YjbR family DNA-binding protein [Acidobacteriota bacterium]MDH3528244.1 MmcQ/YjbR family DNA-binding protein [Acidobacteriota bacterium]
MNIEEIRSFCLSLPHATEDVKWKIDLCFCVGEKMFAVVGLEPGPTVGSFKCTPNKFAELIEREGIVPAPYVARYHWVGLERFDALGDDEFRELLSKSYELVYEKLPKKVRNGLEAEN